MKLIRGIKTKFKDVKVGEIFSMTEHTEINVLKFDKLYFDIKVKQSLTLEYADKGKEYAFNVISLEDGRPRTFHDESIVYVVKKTDLM